VVGSGVKEEKEETIGGTELEVKIRDDPEDEGVM